MGRRNTGWYWLIGVGALLLGGVVAFFVLLSSTDAAVDADIDAHFAQVLDDSATPSDEEGQPRLVETPGSVPKEKPSSRASKKSGRSTKRRTDRPRGSAAAVPGIEEVAPHTYLIDRALFDDAKQRMAVYAGPARATPAGAAGKVEGFALSGITSPHLVAIGLQEGDVLVAVNGHPLTDPQRVATALAAALRASQFRVDLRRGNTPLSFYYRLR